MANDAALRSCMVWLALFIVVIGLYTQSFKKMVVTYFMGLAAIAGILLPDWDFFDRDISQWTKPVIIDHIPSTEALKNRSTSISSWLLGIGAAFFIWFRFYPIRTMIYTVVYAFGLYKWWTYMKQ